MKKTNYHTHTYRCGHANGNEEDMIQAAIDMGIEELGMCLSLIHIFIQGMIKTVGHLVKIEESK